MIGVFVLFLLGPVIAAIGGVIAVGVGFWKHSAAWLGGGAATTIVGFAIAAWFLTSLKPGDMP